MSLDLSNVTGSGALTRTASCNLAGAGFGAAGAGFGAGLGAGLEAASVVPLGATTLGATLGDSSIISVSSVFVVVVVSVATGTVVDASDDDVSDDDDDDDDVSTVVFTTGDGDGDGDEGFEDPRAFNPFKLEK